jgi:hypothetical protein
MLASTRRCLGMAGTTCARLSSSAVTRAVIYCRSTTSVQPRMLAPSAVGSSVGRPSTLLARRPLHRGFAAGAAAAAAPSGGAGACLVDRIKSDMKDAMKAKDQVRAPVSVHRCPRPARKRHTWPRGRCGPQRRTDWNAAWRAAMCGADIAQGCILSCLPCTYLRRRPAAGGSAGAVTHGPAAHS